MATTDKQQVGVLTGAERGKHTIIICCVNAVGMSVSLMMIFPRKNMKNGLIDDASPGTVDKAQQ